MAPSTTWCGKRRQSCKSSSITRRNMLLNSLSLQATFDPVVSRALEHFSLRWSALFVLGGEQWVELSSGREKRKQRANKKGISRSCSLSALLWWSSRGVEDEFTNSRSREVNSFLVYRELLINTRALIVDFFPVETVSYEEQAITYVWKNDEDTLRKSPSLTTLNAYLIKNATDVCDVKGNWRGERCSSSLSGIHFTESALLFYRWKSLGNYSCLKVELTFTRDRAFYFTTVFIPGIILVTSSFITFWLEWNAVPARWGYWAVNMEKGSWMMSPCCRLKLNEIIRNIKARKFKKNFKGFNALEKLARHFQRQVQPWSNHQSHSTSFVLGDVISRIVWELSNSITLTLLLGVSSFLRCRVMIGKFH